MKFIRYFCLLILFSYIHLTLAQDSTSYYTKVSFKKGTPDDLPEELVKMIEISYFLEINSGDIFNCLYLINKSDNIHPDNFWIVFSFDGSSYSFTRSNYSKDSTNNFLFEYKFVTKQEDEITPLQVIYKMDGNIYYKWIGSNSLPEIENEYPYKVGSKLPNFILENSTTKIDLYSLVGNILVINWWATTCAPCIIEIPGLNKICEKYKNVKFISIVYDSQNLDRFLKNHSFNYIHYYGSKDIEKIFGVNFPRNIVLNEKGIIIYNETGAGKNTYKSIEKAILSIIQK